MTRAAAASSTSHGRVGSRRMATETARDRIIDAAIGCIARFGLEHTSISGVATAAGVSRPTVYTHFGTREERRWGDSNERVFFARGPRR